MAEMEKKHATETVYAVSPDSSDYERETKAEAAADADWAPGYREQFPVMGAGALAGILLCMTASIVVLATSNNKSQNRWPDKVRPNVLLTIFSSVSSILFAMLIGNGIAIAWWRKTLNGATISDLHRSWSFSTSLKDIVLSWKYFNVIALAALTAKLAIIDSTLMQKATWTEVRTDLPYQAYAVQGFAAETFYNSGKPSGDGRTGGSMYDWFKDSLKVWSSSPGLLYNTFEGCTGTCFIDLPAAGFAIQCDEVTTQSVEYGNQTTFWYNKTATASTWEARDLYRQYGKTELFEISFETVIVNATTTDTQNGSHILMDLTWVQSSDVDERANYCPGTLNRQTCRLVPSLISYPIMVQNITGDGSVNGVTVGTNALQYYATDNQGPTDPAQGRANGYYNATLQQQNGYKIIKPLIYTANDSATTASDAKDVFAGLVVGLQMYVGANATLQDIGASSLSLNSVGSAANYLSSIPWEKQCGYYYTSPLMPDPNARVWTIAQRINEITFAASTDMGGELFKLLQMPKDPYIQVYDATIYSSSIHYLTNFGFMAGAIASTVICALLILPTYWGYWQLGRKVTLGPLEIAHAFRSPMTAQAKSAALDQVLKEVGDQKIQYGHIVSGEARGVVGVAEPEYVARIKPASSTLPRSP